MASEKLTIIDTRDKQEFTVTKSHKAPYHKPGTYSAHPLVVAKMVKNGWCDAGELSEFPRIPSQKEEN